MKKLFGLLLIFLSFSSFASDFIVVKKGIVTWVLNKDELIVPISLYSREIIPNNMSEKELIEVGTSMARTPFGYRGEYVMTLAKNTDVLKQVQLLVGRKMEELMVLPGPYKQNIILNELTNQTCRRKGILRKKMVCSAEYEVRIEVELEQ